MAAFGPLTVMVVPALALPGKAGGLSWASTRSTGHEKGRFVLFLYGAIWDINLIVILIFCINPCDSFIGFIIEKPHPSPGLSV